MKVKVQQHFKLTRSRMQTEQHILFKRRYLDINLGALLDFFVGIVDRTPEMSTRALTFGLVNLTAPRHNISYGIMPSPPKSVRTQSAELIMTFSLTPGEYETNSVAKMIKRKLYETFVWSVGGARDQFITINLSYSQTGDWDIDRYTLVSMKYMYYAIGLATKNLMTLDERHSVYDAQNFEHIRGRVYNKAIQKTWDSERMVDWFYNYSMWNYAPNTLPQDYLNIRHVTFFYLYINGRLDKSGSQGDDRLLYLLGTVGNEKNTVLSLTEHALTKFRQTLDFSDTDYLVLAALVSVYGVNVNGDVIQKLEQLSDKIVVPPVYDTARMARSLLEQNSTYPRLMFGDGDGS
jgi:hypothetical protein